MKKFLTILLIISLILTISFAYERYYVAEQFGPSSMLAVLVLVCLTLSLAITLILYGTRYHEIMTRTWMLLISTGLTFIVFDLVAGWLLIQPLSPELSPDKYRHHKLVPNTHSRFETKEFSYIQRVNNLGLRGKDTTREKPANHFRILMLGDSYTMGKGVEDNQTFSALIEKSLNENISCPSTTIEVLNAGIDSYAPVLSYIYLSRELAPLEPDAIVLNLDTNDLVQEDVYRKGAIYDDEGKIIGVPGPENESVPLSLRIRRWIDQHLYFTRLVLFYTNKMLGHADLTVEGLITKVNFEVVRYTTAQDTVNRDKQWKQMFESLSKIKKFAEDRAIPFTLVHYPWGHIVNDREFNPGRYQFMPEDSTPSDKYLETLKEQSANAGIDFLNLVPAFRAYDGEKLLYYTYDGHFTAEGHKVMAKQLGKYLQDKLSGRWCK